MEPLFTITAIPLGPGQLALSPLPGRGGDFAGDLSIVLGWRPDMVLSLTRPAEMAGKGASGLGPALTASGIDWRHFPVPDYGTPGPQDEAAWLAHATTARAVLQAGGRVLVHCHGGCGRSGMVALRLMIDAGEEPAAALARLRSARPCAVETDAQHQWALRAADTAQG